MVGRYLLRDLLLRDQTVVVIGRGRGPITGEDRIEALLQDWEQRLQRRLLRPVFIEGQLTEPGLGIRPDSNQRMVLEATDVVLHCAASLRFEEDQAGEEPIRTNLTGTKHVIDFAEAWGIPHFHHISTAYVCGCRTGTVRENELDAGQSFHNIYEHSKFQAEQLLAATGHFQSKTIYRPSIIVGDSLTGFTSTFHTVYSILKFVRALPDEHARNLAWIFQRLNLKGDERKNLVPVDWVSQTICDILDRPTAWGQTFHLTNPQPPKVSELSAAIEAAIEQQAAAWEAMALPVSIADAQAAYQSHIEVYRGYLADDPTFDTTQLDRCLPARPIPTLDAASLIRTMAYAIEHRFRDPTPPIPRKLAETAIRKKLNHLQEVSAKARRRPAKGAVWSLRLAGPGGGVWNFPLGMGEQASIGRPWCYATSDTWQELAVDKWTLEESLRLGRLLLSGKPTELRQMREELRLLLDDFRGLEEATIDQADLPDVVPMPRQLGGQRLA
jgi:nucleoside-diphosphate-sugar epimerase